MISISSSSFPPHLHLPTQLQPTFRHMSSILIRDIIVLIPLITNSLLMTLATSTLHIHLILIKKCADEDRAG